MLIIVVEVDDERGVVGGEMVWRGGGWEDVGGRKSLNSR